MAWGNHRHWTLPLWTGATYMFLTAPFFIPFVHKMAKAVGYRARGFGDVFVLTYGALAAAGVYTTFSLQLFITVAKTVSFLG